MSSSVVGVILQRACVFTTELGEAKHFQLVRNRKCPKCEFEWRSQWSTAAYIALESVLMTKWLPCHWVPLWSPECCPALLVDPSPLLNKHCLSALSSHAASEPPPPMSPSSPTGAVNTDPLIGMLAESVGIVVGNRTCGRLALLAFLKMFIVWVILIGLTLLGYLKDCIMKESVDFHKYR